MALIATILSMAALGFGTELDDGKLTTEESSAVAARSKAIADGWNQAVEKLQVTDEAVLTVARRNLRKAIKAKGGDALKGALFALRVATKTVADIRLLEPNAPATAPADIT